MSPLTLYDNKEGKAKNQILGGKSDERKNFANNHSSGFNHDHDDG